MENMNFLQRPGGLGPTSARVKPIGSLAEGSPSLYESTPATIELNRAIALDNINRITSQYQTDRGERAREQVGPTNYQEGNIMPSAQITGLAGYNQRGETKLPERAADLSTLDYISKTQNTLDPQLRGQMQILTAVPQQTFLNTPDLSTQLLPSNYRMADSLPLQLMEQPKK